LTYWVISEHENCGNIYVTLKAMEYRMSELGKNGWTDHDAVCGKSPEKCVL